MTGGRRGVRAPAFAFTYGYAEARLRAPKGKGLWPAFWLLPVSYDSRPEIDAMEILGDSTSVQHMNFHYLKPDGSRGDAGLTWSGPDFSAGWHTFGVDWEPSAIVWQWNMIEFFEQLGDMLPLPKDGAPRNLCGMRCENGDHSNALQRPEGVFKTDAGIADAKQRPQECAWLRRTG